MDTSLTYRTGRYLILISTIGGCRAQINLKDEKHLGILLGCIGGGILILLTILLICILCRPKKKKRRKAHYNHGHVPDFVQEQKVPVSKLPPGVWTSNPTMIAANGNLVRPDQNNAGLANDFVEQRNHQNQYPLGAGDMLLGTDHRSLDVSALDSEQFRPGYVSQGRPPSETARAFNHYPRQESTILTDRKSYVAKVFSDYPDQRKSSRNDTYDDRRSYVARVMVQSHDTGMDTLSGEQSRAVFVPHSDWDVRTIDRQPSRKKNTSEKSSQNSKSQGSNIAQSNPDIYMHRPTGLHPYRSGVVLGRSPSDATSYSSYRPRNSDVSSPTTGAHSGGGGVSYIRKPGSNHSYTKRDIDKFPTGILTRSTSDASNRPRKLGPKRHHAPPPPSTNADSSRVTSVAEPVKEQPEEEQREELANSRNMIYAQPSKVKRASRSHSDKKQWHNENSDQAPLVPPRPKPGRPVTPPYDIDSSPGTQRRKHRPSTSSDTESNYFKTGLELADEVFEFLDTYNTDQGGNVLKHPESLPDTYSYKGSRSVSTCGVMLQYYLIWLSCTSPS